MRLQFVSTFDETDSVGRLALETLIHEVGSLLIPASRDVVLFDLYLAAQNLITNVLARAALVWSFAHHALVRNNTHSEVVGSQAVNLTAHHLRCHVPGSSTSLAAIIRRQDSCDTKIGQPQIAFVIEDKIFWFDISMYYALVVYGF